MFARNPKTARIGEELLPLEIDYLPEFFRRKAEAEFNYTPTVRQKSLQKLKEAIADDKTLRNHEFTDELLLVNLHLRKYDVRRTVSNLKDVVKFKNSHLYIYINIKFDALEPFLSSEVVNLLPWRCQDGCAIVFAQLGNYDPAKHSVVALHQVFAVILSQIHRYPMTEVNGVKFIFDFNISFQTMRHITPPNPYELYNGGVKLTAGGFKAYHIVNMGIAGRTAYQLLKFFLTEKLKKRVHIHHTIDTLQDFFPRAILPEKLGGDLKAYDGTEWLRKMTSPKELAVLNVMSN